LTLARPADSLGELDGLVHRIAGMRGWSQPTPLSAAVSVLAGDHGVAAHGTSAFRDGVSAAVLRLITAGRAPVNILAGRASAVVHCADFGLREPVGDQRFKVAAGTCDISRADAMTPAQAGQAISNGIGYAEEVLGDAAMVAVGEVGLGNTTVSAALVARLLGRSAVDTVGAGSGVDPAVVARKRRLVDEALVRTRSTPDDPVRLLAALGGYEIAGNVGVILACARRRAVVVLDGYIAGVAALLAERMCPAVRDFLVAAHRSSEPGHGPVLDALGLCPILDLGMRLGMASGAALALPVINSALAVAADTPPARLVGLAESR